MRSHYDLNNEWKFSKCCKEEMLQTSYAEEDMEAVRLPHTNIQTPYNHYNPDIYQFVSCYRRHIKAEESWKDKQALLTFEAVAHVAKVYVNGCLAVTHLGGYTAFTVDIAPYLHFGEDNVIAVEVDSRESCNVPPFGNVIDYLTYGGIYREVSLEIVEEVSIEDVFVRTKEVLHTGEVPTDISLSRQEVELDILLHSDNPDRIFNIRYSLTDAANQVLITDSKQITGTKVSITFQAENVKRWDIVEPNLYFLKLELSEEDNTKPTDEKTIRFGFRSCEFRKDGFYLNDKKVKLVGLNRHQSFPYVGYAMPKRMQQQDAEILKNELQVNAVRTSHYPQSKHFINRCDELGLLVITEIPGWQHIGDEQWKETACENVREMVLQYRNHPSVILWGVRINESQDDDKFYRKTNRIAHELDSTRQTGGIRNFKKSSFLEDVYTYNDFLHNGIEKGLERKADISTDKNKPYLVTEYNGHMYPTKAYDNEEHRLQHALRHVCVLDAAYAQEELAGCTGWCMFDYNTHKDFGSGDMICYHGVLDMFRNPKLAAAVYASQGDQRAVCEISSSLDIGEYPAGNIEGVYAFTNADSIKLYKNDIFIKEYYPQGGKYHNLPHPPILIDDFVGDLLETQEHYSPKTAKAIKEILLAVKKYGQNHLPLRHKLKMAYIMFKEHFSLSDGVRLYYKYIGSWGGTATSFRFEAIKNKKSVKVINKKPSGSPRLSVIANTLELYEDETYDVAEVRITAMDEEGNRLPYYQEPVVLSAQGAVELIGPEVISLKGGATGAYVRTKGISGEGVLKIHQYDLGETEICFQVNKRLIADEYET